MQAIVGTTPLTSNKPQQLWRVITRRVISKDSFRALSKRLNLLGLKAIAIQHKEKITMHAFDDAELFKSRKIAKVAAKFWNVHEVATNIIKADKGVYLLSLGRFYQTVYATEMQQRLQSIDKKYRYQQRVIPIPTWRFTFTPSNKLISDKLWRKLNNTGMFMPITMSEKRFQALYGKSIKTQSRSR